MTTLTTTDGETFAYTTGGDRMACPYGCTWERIDPDGTVYRLYYGPCPHKPVFGSTIRVNGETVGRAASVATAAAVRAQRGGEWVPDHPAAFDPEAVIAAGREIGCVDAGVPCDIDDPWEERFAIADLIAEVDYVDSRIAHCESYHTHPRRAAYYREAVEKTRELREKLAVGYGIAESDIQDALAAAPGSTTGGRRRVALIEWVAAREEEGGLTPDEAAAQEIDRILGEH